MAWLGRVSKFDAANDIMIDEELNIDPLSETLMHQLHVRNHGTGDPVVLDGVIFAGMIHESQSRVRGDEVSDIHQVNPAPFDEWQFLSFPLEVRVTLFKVHPHRKRWDRSGERGFRRR